MKQITAVMLNLAHAIDHMFLLIFATAVGTIATEFGFTRWEDLMPYSVGAFFMFGVGSVPSGRLGDQWGRKRMMEVFFYGMGFAALLAALTQNAWQMAIALVVLGLFGSIYHPVGIPMLVQHSAKPGQTIGVNGLVGNLGIAVAALLTGFIVKYLGWRMAFVIPGIFSIVCGLIFSATTPPETEAPAKSKAKARIQLPPAVLARVFLVMTLAAITSSLLFNFSTNGNAQLLRERFVGIVEDPARLGVLLALVYGVASIAQVIVGRLIDRYPLKRIYVAIILMQVPLFLLAAYASGWMLFVLLIAFMAVIFGAIPFTDAMIVRYVDDSMRSRVSGMRLAVSFGISSLAVWLLGPFVKAAGFQMLLLTMAAIAFCTFLIALLLPSEKLTQTTAAEPTKT